MIRFAFLLSFVLFNAACVAQNRYKSDSVKVDSVFLSYFQVLDAYLSNKDLDRSARRIQIISNLERISHIEADGDGTYIGKLNFSTRNLGEWKTWYLTHRNFLVWNYDRQRVERKPIEKSIACTFDTEVDTIIHALIEKQKKKGANVRFIIYLTKSFSRGCDSYRLIIHSYSGEPLDYLFEIISATPKFYLYGQELIPVCFDSDFDFRETWFQINGVLFKKSIKGSENFIDVTLDGKIASPRK